MEHKDIIDRYNNFNPSDLVGYRDNMAHAIMRFLKPKCIENNLGDWVLIDDISNICDFLNEPALPHKIHIFTQSCLGQVAMGIFARHQLKDHQSNARFIIKLREFKRDKLVDCIIHIQILTIHH